MRFLALYAIGRLAQLDDRRAELVTPRLPTNSL
jgi:hypothetical protein